MLFDGLVRQSEINRLLDGIFCDLGDTPGNEEERILALYEEEGEREEDERTVLLAV